MKLRCPVTAIDIAPGDSLVIPIEVINTSDVIESASVRIIGIDAATLSSAPTELPLFPEAVGQMEVTLELPEIFPAGTYPLTLVVAGVTPGSRSAHHNLELTVPRRPSLRLSASPSVVRARRKASFPVVIHNEGNVPLETALRATDTDRRLRTTLLPPAVTIPAGSSAQATVVVKGPRQLVGTDRDRPVTLQAHSVGTEADLVLTLQQRSTFSRGFITALILLAIVALWVLAFLFGIRYVLGTDPYTKIAPASFFAGMVTDEAGAPEDSGAPDGALPKTGAVSASVGATISGAVTSRWDGDGVARLTVDVLRQTREGLVVVSSTATQGDGSYEVSGLFPGRYLVRVSAEGYEPIWYPNARRARSARTVVTTAQQETADINLRVTGDTATLTGNVLVTDATADIAVTVTAQPTWSGADPGDTQTTTIDEQGRYSFSNLLAPARYQLTFSAEGFRSTTSTERVLGGQHRYALDVALGSGTGSISGVVTDGTDPIGGVTITTTVADETVSVGTPTVGMVGQFTLNNLPTPATYVLTFTKDGFTTRSTVVDLGAGQVVGDLEVQLAGGAGTITGKIVDEDNNGVGGVTVTVGGAATTITTTTLTGSNAGSYTLTGLTIPGQYTLTFTAEGYTDASVPVNLSVDAPSATRNATLRRGMGTVHGLVTLDNAGKAGITVRITDGNAVRETTSTATGDLGRGTYSFDALPPGSYTVTALNDAGRVVATAITRVNAGGTNRADLPMREVS